MTKQTSVKVSDALRRRLTVVVLALCALCLPAAAETIVHPGRACPEIVPAGETFPLMFQAEPGEKVVGVTLTGPYNSQAVTIRNPVEGRYVYDAAAEASCNLRATVVVPKDCPQELYDLAVRTNKREVVARKAVKVLKAFGKRCTLAHVTDAHITKDWTGDLETGFDPALKQVEQVVNTVNIIAPDFVIHTGDAIMDSTKPAVAGLDAKRKWECFYEGSGGVRGFHGLNAPFFAVAGNHDHFEANNNCAAQYVRYNGLRTFGFAYGTGRFMIVDDSLSKDLPAQFKVLDAFLDRSGAGEFRAICQHQPTNVDAAFLEARKVQLALTGHIHRNAERKSGDTLILSTKNVGRPVSDGPGWFRVITIEGPKIISNVTVQYGDIKTLKPLMTLDYEAANDGTATSNRATIANGFDVAWPECKVRFVMKPGAHTVSGGRIEQVIQGVKAAVYDVRVDVPGKGTATVTINGR